jgi:hypothetical protein
MCLYSAPKWGVKMLNEICCEEEIEKEKVRLKK